MFSIAFSDGNIGFICDKCKETVRLTEKISELETRIQTLIEESKDSTRDLDTILDAPSIVNSLHDSVPAEVEPVQQGRWVTVRDRHSSRGSKNHSSVPIPITNRFAPLSETPTENHVDCALVIGDSITRNVKIETPANIVHMLAGSQSA